MLMQTSRLLTAVVAQSLVEANSLVTTPQLRVLVILSSVESSNVSGLAERLGVNASNASRVCDQLVDEGLVVRRASDEDRRQVVMVLTEAGMQLIDSLMARRRALFTSVVAAMSAEDRDHLGQGLAGFLRAADEVAASEELLAPSVAAGGVLSWLA